LQHIIWHTLPDPAAAVTADPAAAAAAAAAVVTQAEVSGEVVKILIENGTSVQPGQPIMLIKP
jgi:multidrug resistance efflux pump